MKTGKVQPLVLYFSSSSSSSYSSPSLCILFPLLLFILFLPLLPLSTTYDLNSSHVSLFFMLNFIIITISLGSSKPASTPDFDRFFYSFPLVNEVGMNDKIKNEEQQDLFYDSDGDEYCHGYDGYDEDNDDDIDGEDIYTDEDDDRDLEGRIEEFIAKVNRKWREELLIERLGLSAA